MVRQLAVTIKGNGHGSGVANEMIVEQKQVYANTPPGIITVYQIIVHGPGGLQGVWVDPEQMMELAEWIVTGPVEHL